MTSPRLLLSSGRASVRSAREQPGVWPRHARATLTSVGPTPGPAFSGRVVIASNRLPVTVRLEGGGVRLEPSSGGLATGLSGVHAESDGVWVGWTGVPTLPDAVARRVDERLEDMGAVGVSLDADEIAGFYERYANGTLWPLLHDRTDQPPPSPADWETYRAVNLRYAEAIGRQVRPGDRVWVHDYHLMLVPRLLRARHPGARVGFFLHTPFPDPATLAALPAPQRAALLDGLLGADVVAFHTAEYAERFAEAVRTVLGRETRDGIVMGGARAVRLQACPMGIDVDAFAARAAEPRVVAAAERLREEGGGGALLVGVDRLDYTKGLPERLAGFARLLERHPELRGRVRLHQLAVPSREQVPAYQALREQVEGLVAEINARFGTAEWTPVSYVYGCVDARGLAALYRAADVMLVTPLRDGMNLVAKEFVASRVDHDGVLVLGERAGAASELRAALLVDPSDVDGLAGAYHAALTMSAAERRVRMRRLRSTVIAHDVFRWARSCVGALTDRR